MHTQQLSTVLTEVTFTPTPQATMHTPQPERQQPYLRMVAS